MVDVLLRTFLSPCSNTNTDHHTLKEKTAKMKVAHSRPINGWYLFTIIKILLIKIATEYFISTHVTQSSFLSTLLVHLSEISETIIAQQSHALLCFCFTIMYIISILHFFTDVKISCNTRDQLLSNKRSNRWQFYFPR